MEDAGPLRLIGIDCAADPANVGLALGDYRAGAVTLRALAAGSAGNSIAATLAGWLAGGPPALLALDAPLGWPAPLGEALAAHRAGAALLPAGPGDGRPEANRFFRRETDRFIRAQLGQQPLDVGADRIARAAFAALWMLEELRARIGAALPLAWSPAGYAGVQAIEVYPAATLRACRAPHRGYKEPGQRQARETILAALQPHLAIACDHAPLLASGHLLDAAICLLAAGDFLAGRAMPPPPEARPLARREGWIWVRRPAHSHGEPAHEA